jgi:hypothetical protein
VANGSVPSFAAEDASDRQVAGGVAELRDARAAVANIDPRSVLAFQRAAIQDGVRATLSAFIALHGGCCPAPQTARPAP